MAKKKTHEEFVKEVYNLVGEEYEVLGVYDGNRTKIKFRHNKCSHIFDKSPSDFIKGIRCSKCSNEIRISKNTKTHSDFVKEVIEIRGDVYDFLTDYEGMKVRIKIRHRECGHTWEASPYKIVDKNKKGTYCPNCNVNYKKLTHEKFVKNVIEMHGDIYEFITCYISLADRITIKHKECGYIWSPLANQLSNKSRKGKVICPNCNWGNGHNLEMFKQNVYELVKDEYIVLGNYINAVTKIKMKHNIDTCLHEYYVAPNSFIRKESRCPKCSESKGEKRVRKWLEENNIQFEPQKEFEGLIGLGGGLLRFDFVILDINFNLISLVEYDGEFHFKKVYNGDEYERTVEHDKRKNNYCKENSIQLIRIPYWKFNEIESILNNLILNKEYIEIDENYLVI